MSQEKDLLPIPPDNREKYLYLRQNRLSLYTFGFFSTLFLLTGGTLFSFHQLSFAWFFIFVLLTAIYLGISYFIGIFSKAFNFAGHQKIVADGKDYKPTIDVYLPCCGEPLDIIKNTHFWVSKLDWPSDKLTVHVLDDKGVPEIEESAKKYNYNYISRPNKGELKKAGNIRHAFAKTESEIIAIFDADFCPRPDFLNELVPYMQDQKVGLVQSPQFFNAKAEMSPIERGAASIQELFYRLIQVNRNTWGGSICVGSCAIYRRTALEPYGGTYPIQHSEDVHTGFNLIKDGWKLIYVPINLAKGRCPDTLSSFFTQQYRWCTGSTSLLLNRELFWGSKIPFMTRTCYLSGMLYYSATAMGLFFTPLPGLLMIWFSPEFVIWYNLVFSLPSFFFGIIFMTLWNKEPYGLYSLKARYVSYYAHAFALWDRLRSSVMEWVPTHQITDHGAISPAAKRTMWFKRLLLWWPVSVLFLGFLGATIQMTNLWDFDFYPYLFFSSFYCYLQISTLFEEKHYEKSKK